MKACLRILPALFVLSIAVARAGAAPLATNDPRLAQWLTQYPAADVNKDGTLTWDEARAFRAQLQAAWRRQQAAPALPPDYRDVKYGPDPRNVLDFWRAATNVPAPLVVYFHGGGFVGGDKSSISAGLVRECVQNGIAVAAAHYRFVTTAPFPAPQRDAARAIQFLRSKAAAWNIDPTRVAAFGGSAGAGISLWLALHADLAETNSPDPVARQSTRLRCAGSFGGQSTYDPHVIRAWIGGRAFEHSSVLLCYRAPSLAALDNPALQPLYDEASAITHLTKDDPPVFMFYSEPDQPLAPDADPGVGIHHPVFGRKLKAAMDALGIPAVYYHQDTFHGDAHKEMLKYFRIWFDMTNAPPAQQ